MEKIYNNFYKETYYYHKFKNGLRFYFLYKPEFSSSSMAMAINFGSLALKQSLGNKIYKHPAGIAHFMEHLMFNHEGLNVADKLSALGASPNAFTSRSETIYFQSLNSTNYKEALALLIDYTSSFEIDEKMVNKEKDIILEELNMTLLNPFSKLYYNSFKTLSDKHPIREEILGSSESIKAMNPEILKECFKLNYQAKNKALVIAGNYDVNELFEFVREKIEGLNDEYDELPKTIFPKEKEKIKESFLELNHPINNPMYAYSFRVDTDKENYLDLCKLELCFDFLLDLIFSRINKDYDNWLLNNQISYLFNYGSFVSPRIIQVIFINEGENHNEFVDFIDEKISNFKFNDADFELIKKKYIQTMFNYFDNIEDYCLNFARYIIHDINYFELKELVDKISKEDIINVLKLLNKDNSYVTKISNKE